MIKSIGTFNTGNYRAKVFLDEYSPVAYVGDLYYVFKPPLIVPICVYLRVRDLSGTQREFPINIKLQLQGDITHVPKDQIEYFGSEIYDNFQITDHIFKICVRRSGFYKILISDKQKNEWIHIKSSGGSPDYLFVEGLGTVDYPMKLGSAWSTSFASRNTKVFFSIYNFREDIVSVDIESEFMDVSPISPPGKPSYWSEFFGDWYNPNYYNSFGFGYTSMGKHTFWVDVYSDARSPEGIVRIIFKTKSGGEIVSYIYNRGIYV